MSVVQRKLITRRGALNASVSVPGSKSISNRAVLLAALARGRSELTGVLDSDDLRVMAHALQALGVPVEVHQDRWLIEGQAGRLHGQKAGVTPLDVQASGTAARFLTAVATLAEGPVRLDGTPRMRQRPINDLVDALRGLGAQIDIEGERGCPPLLCHGGGLAGGAVTVDASRSSQYVSALLQVAPYARDQVTINLREGVLVSRPYVDVTLGVMEAFGIKAGFADERTLTVHSSQGYQGRSYQVEPDASTAAYFFAAAAIAGGRVCVEGLPGASRQADMAVLDLLERMGCHIDRNSNSCAVTGPDHELQPIVVDMNAMPDAVLAMAVVALFAKGTSRIENVANLRIKESDRLAALETELRKLGAEAHADEDSLTITPGPNLHGAVIDTYDDHRMAMAFSLAGLRVPGVEIRDPQCVSKSFPGYFDLFDTLR